MNKRQHFCFRSALMGLAARRIALGFLVCALVFMPVAGAMASFGQPDETAAASGSAVQKAEEAPAGGGAEQAEQGETPPDSSIATEETPPLEEETPPGEGKGISASAYDASKWYQVGAEWVYKGNNGTNTFKAVSIWTNPTGDTGLLEALDFVNNYNPTGADAQKLPYVILIAGDITMDARYTFANKNVILRKAGTTVTQNAYDYATWPYSNPNATRPDLYDGVADYRLLLSTVSANNNQHFNVDNTGESKLSLENITLDGESVGKASGGAEPTAIHGGIQCAASQFTFSGNIANCASSNAQFGIFNYNQSGGTLNIVGGVFSGNCARIGGGLTIFSTSNTTATISRTIIENNYSFHEGGAIYVRNYPGHQLTTSDTIIRNNESWAGSSGIAFLTTSGGALTLNTGTTISGNTSKSTGDKGSSNTYPGNGGAVELFGTTTLNVNAGVKLNGNTAWRGGGAISSVGNAVINLNGGEISGNKALGTYRQASNDAQTDLAIGGGGAIYTVHPEKINIPLGSNVTFSDNSAAFVAMNAIDDSGDTPGDYRNVFPADTNYNTHIKDYLHFRGNGNSAGFPAPYDNLYNNNDIGVPNNSSTAFGKLHINATVGGSLTRTVTTQGQDFYDVFPNHDWLGLQVGAEATLVANPSPGYFFTGWTRASTTLEAGGITSAGITELNTAVPPASLSNTTLTLRGMPAADLSLIANFAPIPRANLTGFSVPRLSATMLGGVYPTPAASPIALENSGNADATALSITLDPASFKKDGLPWTGFAPLSIISGINTVMASGGRNDTWRILPAANLSQPGNYTATVVLRYHDGLNTVTRTAQASFALIDPNIPLLDLSSHDFGSVIGSRYTVGSGQNVIPQLVEITNLASVTANMTAVTLEGPDKDAFTLNTGTNTVAGGATNDSWSIRPKTNLATGSYTAELHVNYEDQAGNNKLRSVAPVTFTVLAPALLVPDPDFCNFSFLPPGYPLATSQQLSLENQGTADATITSIVPDLGAASSAFLVIPGNPGVSAGGTNRNWEVVPKTGLPLGLYDETFTVSYSYTDAAGTAAGTATFSAYFIVGATNSVAVTYRKNDGTTGTVSGMSSIAYGGGTLSAAPAAPARPGYTFAGWYTEAAAGQLWVFGTGKTATRLTQANGVVNTNTASGPDLSLTLYAHWTERSDYQVTYNLNGGTSTAIPPKTAVKWGDTGLLPGSAPTRPGWGFVAWYTIPAQTGGSQVTALTTYSALAANDSVTTVAIHARWTDISPPTATVNYKNKGLTAFLNKITFGLFFKDTISVVIQGSDAESGMQKIEYLTTTQTFANTTAAIAWAGGQSTWTSVAGQTASFGITSAQRGKLHVFARATDNANNSSISFDGITLYADSMQTGQNATFIRGSNVDITLDATLNGNTVASVLNQTEKNAGGTGLVHAGSSWTSSTTGGTGGQGSITLKNAYLSTLAAGPYSFTVSYNPQGVAYAPDLPGDTRNETPNTTNFTVTVVKDTQPTLAIDGLNSSRTYTYGDTAISIGAVGGAGTGNISYIMTPTAGGTDAFSIRPLSSVAGGATLDFHKPGSMQLQATRAGDMDYMPVSSGTLTVTTDKAVPPVSLTAEARRGGGTGTGAYGDDILLTATVRKVGIGVMPAGSVNFFVDGTAVSANPVTLNASGEATYQVPTPAAGPHSFEVSYNGNGYYKGYGTANTADTDTKAKGSAAYTVGMSNQSIMIHDPGNKTWGDGDFTLSLDTAGAGTGAVTYTAVPAGILQITGNTASIVGTGSVTITASKAIDNNYNAASSSVMIAVGKATPVWLASATGAPITYGRTLSSSVLTGAVVRGVGTHAGDMVTGQAAWNNPAAIPDVSAIPGTPAGYAVSFTPTGPDAQHYVGISGMADVTVDKAAPSLRTPLSATPILMSSLGDKLANSTITGGNTGFFYGAANTMIPGIWGWSGQPPLTTGWTAPGVVTAAAVFVPADTARFNSITEVVSLQVFSPKTVITTAPTASVIRYGDRISDSVLNTSLAKAMATMDASPGVEISGSWDWSVPSDRANAVGSYPAEVTFTPANLAPLPLVAGNGYVRATTDVAIVVKEAIPRLESAQPGYVVYGKKLSMAHLNIYTVTGAFGETIQGTLVWKNPDIIPSDQIGKEVGTYAATCTFTPTGNFAALYETRDFTVDVRVVADAEALNHLDNDVVRPTISSLHEENYKAGDVQAIKETMAAANAILSNMVSTQASVDQAYAALKAAYETLRPDHPVLGHSHPDGLTTTGAAVTVRFKGDYSDTSALKFGLKGQTLKDYSLTAATSGNDPVFAISNETGQIGTITPGSAVVTLQSDFLEKLPDGDYELRLTFTDNLGPGEGVAPLKVAWATGGDQDKDKGGGDKKPGGNDKGGNTSSGGNGPDTGDDADLMLWLGLGLAALSGIILLVRRRIEMR